MLIDNSAAQEFRTCPLLYYYNRIKEGTGLELKPKMNEVTPLDLGSRIHQLLEEYYQELKGQPQGAYVASSNEALENEAQMIMAAYRAKYPQEAFEIVDVERTFKVQLPDLCHKCYSTKLELRDSGGLTCLNCGGWDMRPGRHIYTGKIDVVFRENGILNIMDHKSEKRRSNSNHPRKWAAKDQASLYLWAASQIYKEPIGNFYVNVLKRPSDKLQEGPIFPERQRLERTEEQIKIAVRDLVFIADDIERYKSIFGDNLWPSNREMCTDGTWGDCDFYLPDTYGWSDEIRKEKYQPKTPYLQLEGIEVLRDCK